MNHFEFLLPGLMGYAVIYMGMMVALSLVEFRQSGVLDRIKVTPVSTAEFLISQIIANMIIAVIQALIVLFVAWVLGFRPLGGIAGLILVVMFLALLAVTAVGLGLITAAVSKDTGVAGGLSVIFILPMMMFGALLAVFNDATLAIAKFTPNFYVSASLMTILFEGKVNDPSILKNFLILSVIGVVIVMLGIQLFERVKTP
jgi:ABC-2 type transport system permease protein